MSTQYEFQRSFETGEEINWSTIHREDPRLASSELWEAMPGVADWFNQDGAVTPGELHADQFHLITHSMAWSPYCIPSPPDSCPPHDRPCTQHRPPSDRLCHGLIGSFCCP